MIEYVEGFYGPESDGIRPFRWMGPYGEIAVDSMERKWLLFEAGHPGIFPVRLTLRCGETERQFTITNGWQQLAFDLSDQGGIPCRVTLETDARHDAEDDTRTLALMMGNVRMGIPTDYEKNSFLLHTGLFTKTRLKSLPTFLTFETSAVCNMQCAMCVVDSKLKRYDPDRIKTTDKIDYLYDQLLPAASKVELHATGEVLTGQDFWKALEKAAPQSALHSLEIEIFTNGQLLTPENIERIVDSPLTDLVVSMDAATEKTYRRIRGGDFQNLLGNLRYLGRAAKERCKPRVALAMVLMRENIGELPSFVRMAHDLDIRTVTFWPLFAAGLDMPPRRDASGFVFYYPQQMLIHYPNLTNAMINQAHQVAGDLGVRIGVTPCFSKDYRAMNYEDLPYPVPVEEFNRLSLTPEHRACTDGQPDAAGYRSCYLPWKTAFVTTEGRFSPCVLMTYLGGIDSVIGKDFLTDVWNSQTMQELRQAVIDGIPHRLCQKAQCVFVNKLY
jgi:MoaA/NifB/PqqE/SkfB family radical SAM enzyme